MKPWMWIAIAAAVAYFYFRGKSVAAAAPLSTTAGGLGYAPSTGMTGAPAVGPIGTSSPSAASIAGLPAAYRPPVLYTPPSTVAPPPGPTQIHPGQYGNVTPPRNQTIGPSSQPAAPAQPYRGKPPPPPVKPKNASAANTAANYYKPAPKNPLSPPSPAVGASAGNRAPKPFASKELPSGFRFLAGKELYPT
jgi:hypothetical protein